MLDITYIHGHINPGEKAIHILALSVEQEQIVRDSNGAIQYDEHNNKRIERKELQVTRFRSVASTFMCKSNATSLYNFYFRIIYKIE